MMLIKVHELLNDITKLEAAMYTVYEVKHWWWFYFGSLLYTPYFDFIIAI